MSGREGRATSLLLFTNSVQVGGMEEHVRLIAQELNGNGFSVTAVMPDWEETNWFAKRIESHTDRMVLITPDRRPGGPGPFREALRLARLVRKRRIEVAHLHSTTYDGQLLALAAIRLAGVRRILVTEHLAPEHRMPRFRRLRRRVAERMMTGIVAVSARNRAARLQFLGGPANKTHVVDNGIDIARFDDPITDTQLEGLRLQYAIPANVELVGTAIRLEPGKGMSDLIDGFAVLRQTRPRAHLLIVGDGSLRPELEAQCQRLGLSDHVTMTGFIPDPRALISLMDVFVLPVPYGSASIVLLEAMAMAKPCVISFGGDGEAVEPGISGHWATPRDPSSIAANVEMLLADPEHRAEVSREARLRIEKRFSSDRMAEQLAMLYRDDSGS